MNIEINAEECVGCGVCIDTCPARLFELVDDKAVVTGDVSECLECRECESNCPTAAIILSE